MMVCVCLLSIQFTLQSPKVLIYVNDKNEYKSCWGFPDGLSPFSIAVSLIANNCRSLSTYLLHEKTSKETNKQKDMNMLCYCFSERIKKCFKNSFPIIPLTSPTANNCSCEENARATSLHFFFFLSTLSLVNVYSYPNLHVWSSDNKAKRDYQFGWSKEKKGLEGGPVGVKGGKPGKNWWNSF